MVDFLLGNEKKIRFAVRDPSSWFGVKKRPHAIAWREKTGKVRVDVCLFRLGFGLKEGSRESRVGVAFRPIALCVSRRRRFEPALEIWGEHLVDDAERSTVALEDVVASPERTWDAPLGGERG